MDPNIENKAHDAQDAHNDSLHSSVSECEEIEDDDNSGSHNYDHDDDDEEEPCFFADATLDLEDARCIEDTNTPVFNTFKTINKNCIQTTCTIPVHLGKDNRNDDMKDDHTTDKISTGSRQLFPPTGTGIDTCSTRLSEPKNVISSKNHNKKIINDTKTTGISTNTNTNNNANNNNNISNIQPQRIVNNLSPTSSNLAPITPPKTPKRPRDVKYILFFFLSILLFFISIFILQPYCGIVTFSTTAQFKHTVLPTIITAIVAIVLSKLIYSSRGGDEGDESRYTIATLVFISNLLSCLFMPILTLQIYYLDINVTKNTTTITTTTGNNVDIGNDNSSSYSNNLVLHWYWYRPLLTLLVLLSIREFYIFATLFKFNNSSSNINTNHNLNNQQSQRSAVSLHESINDGQRTMFRMLLNVALDVLSRSLRPMSIYRFIVLSIILQFGILHLSLNKYLCAVGADRPWIGTFILFVSYWFVYTLIKLIALVCSGGITSWFAQQALLMEQMEQMKYREQQQQLEKQRQNIRVQEESFMPEAYRNVNANIYSSVMEFDEGMDDDFDFIDDDIDEENISVRQLSSNHSHTSAFIAGISGERSSHFHANGSWQHITVKSFLIHSLTKSFGSLLQCALFGPVVNMTANAAFYFDKVLITILAPRHYLRRGGFQQMALENHRFQLKEKIFYGWKTFHHKATAFVISHNEIGLCHVATYYKSYQRASHDVAMLMNASGTSLIMDNDISSHMCTSVSKSISLILVILLGQPLSSKSSGLDHSAVCSIMMVTFVLCYLLLKTMMEGLRSSVKAVYVSFAQHPQSFSQAFPLLYHRLSRIANEHNVQ